MNMEILNAVTVSLWVAVKVNMSRTAQVETQLMFQTAAATVIKTALKATWWNAGLVEDDFITPIFIELFWKNSSYVGGVSVFIFVALYLCMFGCLLQEPIRLNVLWVDA